MKSTRILIIVTLTLLISLCSLYRFVYKGNNRLSVWLHHGLWLPPSAENISFYLYPGFMAHLVNLDDWAKTELEIPKADLYTLLKDQQYRYITRIDTAANKLSWTTYMSRYHTIPDSILNGSLPIDLDLKSARGDFLLFYAKEKENGLVYVHLYTDWN